MGQSLLRAAEGQAGRPPLYFARTGFQVAARPLALLAETAALRSGKIPQTTRKETLSNRSACPPNSFGNGCIKNQKYVDWLSSDVALAGCRRLTLPSQPP